MVGGGTMTGGPAGRVAHVLFIGGWGRSGSTLVDRLTGRLDGVVAVGELRDVWQRGVVEDRLCGCGQRFSACPFWQEVGQRAFQGWATLDLDWVSHLRSTVDRPWRCQPSSYRLCGRRCGNRCTNTPFCCSACTMRSWT